MCRSDCSGSFEFYVAPNFEGTQEKKRRMNYAVALMKSIHFQREKIMEERSERSLPLESLSAKI